MAFGWFGLKSRVVGGFKVTKGVNIANRNRREIKARPRAATAKDFLNVILAILAPGP